MNEVTVLVLTYNGECNAILSTINSIIKQKKINVKLVISDDGSDHFYKEKIIQHLKNAGFNDYIILDNNENRGTVLNIVNALEYVHTKYIKIISQGDLLYNDNTLNSVVHFMDINHFDVAYGKMVGYLPNDLTLVERYSPKDSLYYVNNNIRKAAEEFILYLNGPCGALHFYKTKILKKYICEIAGKVKYCEDNIIGLMMLDGIRIAYYPEFIIYYEIGNGVSSSMKKGQSRRMREDQIRCFDLFATIRKCSLTYKAKKLYRINRIDNRTLRHILKIVKNPAAICFEVKWRLNRPKNKKELAFATAKKDFLYNCIIK